MSKKLMGLAVLTMVAVAAFLGCNNTDAQKQREAQVSAQMQRVEEQAAANAQALAAIETRLQILEEDFNNNISKIRDEIAKTKISTHQLSSTVATAKAAEGQAAADGGKGVLPGWLEFILILAIIVAALLLLLYLLRPKPVEDEDFEDFDDMEDFEAEEGEAGDSGDAGGEKKE